MKIVHLLSVLLLAASAAGTRAADETIFSESFDTPEAVARYRPGAGIDFVPGEGSNGSGCIRFRQDAVGTCWLQIPIDPAKLRGRAIQLEAMMKAENIAKPSPGYMGPKLMLNLQGPGENSFSEQEKVHGTYGWRKFQVFAQVAPDIKKAVVAIGIQHGQGTLFMDDIKLTLVPTGETEAFTPPAAPLQTRPKFRGMMSGYRLTPQDIRDFAVDFGGNLLRWQLLRGNADTSTPEKYMAWLDSELDRLDAVMPTLKKYGVKVAIDLHGGPGTNQDKYLTNQLSWDVLNQNLLVETWEKIARRYKGNPMIYGYDLLNEPREDNYVYEPGGALEWNRLALRTAKAIRAIDSDVPIIVETAKGGGPDGIKTLRPINLPNIIYSVHVYSPHAFTHQGITAAGKNSVVTYPSKIDGKEWNREALKEKLQPVRDFQKKYNVPIFIGEFSAIAWAPGADKYLDDCISIFEEYGWDWTYHAFREWTGWSVEHGGTFEHQFPVENSTRKQVLQTYFKRNAERMFPTQAEVKLFDRNDLSSADKFKIHEGKFTPATGGKNATMIFPSGKWSALFRQIELPLFPAGEVGFTCTIKAKLSGDSSTFKPTMLYLTFMDKTGKRVGNAFEKQFKLNGETQTLTVSGTIPAGAAFIRPEVNSHGGPNMEIGDFSLEFSSDTVGKKELSGQKPIQSK